MVGQGVRDDGGWLVPDWVGTEGSASGPLALGQSDLGFEPLAVLVEKADIGHRHVANVRGELDEIVKGLFRLCIQNAITAQGIQSLLFSLSSGGWRHWGHVLPLAVLAAGFDFADGSAKA